jgi:hypothetical protein
MKSLIKGYGREKKLRYTGLEDRIQEEIMFFSFRYLKEFHKGTLKAVGNRNNLAQFKCQDLWQSRLEAA